jgi:transcriptional regulator with XRE-family HTH domain
MSIDQEVVKNKKKLLLKLIKQCKTQTNLAKRLGITQPTISQLLTIDSFNISANLAAKISREFNISFWDIRPDLMADKK